jgi:FlaA1/EpsC-like NDP-sugar epimerase
LSARHAAEGLSEALFSLPRSTKRAIMLVADLLAVELALLCVDLLTSGSLSGFWRWRYWVIPAICLPSLAAMGVYRAVVRYVSAGAVSPVVLGVALSATLLLMGGLLAGAPVTLLREMVIFSLFAFAFLSSSRHLARVLLSLSSRAERVAIYGAGEPAARLLAASRYSRRVKPVALLDPDPRAWGSTIAGLRVSSPSALARLVEDQNVQRVLLVLPEDARRERREALAALAPYRVAVQIVPDVLDGSPEPLARARDVELADLICRDPVPPKLELLTPCVQERSVLVTGAGGSIGSELCRQIVELGPRRLVLLELSEAALYQIDREIRLRMADVISPPELVSLLGDCRDRRRMREIFRHFEVETVYHAAAYKHVPIVEENVVEGVRNNVLATWHAAAAAADARVKNFVLVSTDKAVNPTSVMGASKRLAELALQGLHESESETLFCMVRFGNVIASSGSVVPLFQEQVRQGGPVTVTHPDVIRYFMTIPEAVHLVIQAGAMAKGGDVFVLDMGEPVRIDDLARRVIQLLGHSVRDAEHPDGTIEIEYTGLRPGEKLYEELLLGSNVTTTEHPKILRAMERSLPRRRVASVLADLEHAVDRSEHHQVRQLLQLAIPEYKAGAVHDLLASRSGEDDRTPWRNAAEPQRQGPGTSWRGRMRRSATGRLAP